jgi:hypothetical protein
MARTYLLTAGLVGGLLAGAISLPVRAADETIDYESLSRIRAQGLTPATSQVMATASWLTDVYGPRLTGSPNIVKAAEWAASRLREWGVENVALEPWPSSPDAASPVNSFPRGWVNDKFYMAATAPQAFPIPGTPSAWTPGTNGLVTGEVALVIETSREEIEQKYGGGKLKGKWLITSPAVDVPAYWSPLAQRYTEDELDRMETPPRDPEFGTNPGRGRPGGAPPTPARGGRAGGSAPFDRNAFFKAEGALGVLSTVSRGHGVYVIGGSNNRTTDPSALLPLVTIPAEQYGRIARLLEKNLPVTIEAEIRNSFQPSPPMFNLVGEIRGTSKTDELVMLGAHFDSWHASTGATDNAAGSAVVLEVMRILKQSGVPLRRTVRLALWTGEEQGLIGSAAYVRQHFGGGRGRGGQAPTPPTPEHARFAGYFNLDNGTGAIRGVHLQQNQAVAPIFRQWMEPFRDLGMTHLRYANTGGTDHTSFDTAGLPGWQFIQDEIEYEPLTHHTNLDSYERLQPEDMRRNATILAGFVFLAANREEKLPRKPAPAAPTGGRGAN